MTWRQLVLLALSSSVYNECGKMSVSGFCSATRRKAGHFLGLAHTSKLMISKHFNEASRLMESDIEKRSSSMELFSTLHHHEHIAMFLKLFEQ